jgi:amino acid transporter
MGYIVLIASSVLLIIFWLFIWPLLKYRDRLSYDTKEEVFPDIVELAKTSITICSVAIILTINLIGKPVIEKNYLIISWVSLIICIVFGILLLLANYAHRVAGRVFLSGGFDTSNSKNKKDGEEGEFKKIFTHWGFSHLIIIILIFLLVSSLFVSFLFMIAFGLKNI